MEVRRQSLWTGWSKLNHIIPVWVFFSVYNVFYASLGKHFEFDVDVAFCYECVCVYMEILEYERFKKLF